ncbi:hypothetical protein MNBD_CHLOROFLEXI01-5299 [hydrothermal vent metagenome]|uniref:MvaI/BcnI restriction endonuclease domain-containing protein n=1 Tax=hydrothermal vent metagenome TaxID=652676 RepID=A0A3B0UKZ0_9ZZZZ
MSNKRKPDIYDDNTHSLEFSLQNLISLYRDAGVSKILFKRLAPNDNSKNQPYVGSHLTDLGFLPTGAVTASKSISTKTKNRKRKVKYQVQLDYYWLSSQGKQFHAPNAKLIYYPQYPEVRLSGFLSQCSINIGKWMDPNKSGRAEGRILFLGIKKPGSIIACLATPESRIAKEIDDAETIQLNTVFEELPFLTPSKSAVESKAILIDELKRIHLKGWIEGKRLDKYGNSKPYAAPNGGGYTLEAELGITPNGYSEPDYLGWEVKQFGVKKFHLINSKILTLMTPEPDKGFYFERGVEAFVRTYGYENSTRKAGRFDFNGRHIVDQRCDKTGLTLILQGYDRASGQLIDASGFIGLQDKNGILAAGWSYTKIITLWKRKHNRAVFIPSLSRILEGHPRSYHYGNQVRLFEGTSILNLLGSLAIGTTYYDPGIKLENAHTSSPKTKRRSQFRAKSSHLPNLYHEVAQIDVLQWHQ